MAAVKFMGRMLATCLGLVLVAVGGFALAHSLGPDHAAVASLHDRLLTALMDVPHGNLAASLDPVLEHPVVRYGLVPAGLALVFLGIRSRRATRRTAAAGQDAADPREGEMAAIDKKEAKKALKQAAALAKAGRSLDAAELCFSSGAMEAAATYFVGAEEFERAAEIRHDQNRFIESAELYLQAGCDEAAGAMGGDAPSRRDAARRARTRSGPMAAREAPTAAQRARRDRRRLRGALCFRACRLATAAR